MACKPTLAPPARVDIGLELRLKAPRKGYDFRTPVSRIAD
jgi:hypothetical protein